MTSRLRTLFGVTALCLWLLSLALPAYHDPRVGPVDGLFVLMTGWLGLYGLQILPPGSAIGWMANFVIPIVALWLISGGRVRLWVAGTLLIVAALGLGPHVVWGGGVGTPATGSPAIGQLVWFASALAIAAPPVWEKWNTRRQPVDAPLSPHPPG